MSKHDVVNRVVAYRYGGGAAVRCGLVIGVEGDNVRIFEYSPVVDPSEHVCSVERDIASEDAVIAAFQQKLDEMSHHDDDTLDGGCVGGDGLGQSLLQEKWLQWAKDGLRRVPAEDFRRLAKLPAAALTTTEGIVCSAVSSVLKSSAKPATMEGIAEVFSQSELVDNLCQLDAIPLPQATFDSISKHHCASPLCTSELAAKCSPAVAALYKWLMAFMDLQKARFARGVDLERQQQLHACRTGLDMALHRRQRLQEDLTLTHKGMLHRRTNRIEVTPYDSILKVMTEAPPRLGREFVIKGLVDVEGDGQLAIVNRSPRAITTTTGTSVSASAGSAASSQLPMPGVASSASRLPSWRRGSYCSARSFAESSSSAVAPASTSASAAAATATPSAAEAPAPAFSTTATSASSAATSLPAAACAGPSPPLTSADGIATATPRPIAALPLPAAPSATLEALRALRRELAAAAAVQAQLLSEWAEVAGQRDSLARQAQALLEERRLAQAVWRRERAAMRRELLLAKAVVKMLRGDGVASGEAKDGRLYLPANAGEGPVRQAPPCVSGPPLYLQDALLSTSEYLRGVMATMELPLPYQAA